MNWGRPPPPPLYRHCPLFFYRFPDMMASLCTIQIKVEGVRESEKRESYCWRKLSKDLCLGAAYKEQFSYCSGYDNRGHPIKLYNYKQCKGNFYCRSFLSFYFPKLVSNQSFLLVPFLRLIRTQINFIFNWEPLFQLPVEAYDPATLLRRLETGIAGYI